MTSKEHVRMTPNYMELCSAGRKITCRYDNQGKGKKKKNRQSTNREWPNEYPGYHAQNENMRKYILKYENVSDGVFRRNSLCKLRETLKSHALRVYVVFTTYLFFPPNDIPQRIPDES